VKDGAVSRADECKPLFLSQSGSHARMPLCQWKPFGATRVEHTDVEVRNHENCVFHQLRYEGVSWDCEGERREFQPPALDRDREAISESATRDIFGWLRRDGYAPYETNIWQHEWFESSDSDSDEADGEEKASSEPHKAANRVMVWLSNLSADDDASEEHCFGPNVTFDGDCTGVDHI
jgi:hypothetical protein